MTRTQYKLSPRFKTFIEFVLRGQPFWDLCCDHGYVGLEVFFSKKCPEVHLVDQVPHIIKKIEIQLSECEHDGLNLHIEKAEKLKHTLTGTVLIAGVGGKTIQIILSELMDNDLLKAQRLMLSPHTDLKAFNDVVESSKFSAKYVLTDKLPLEEGGIIKTLFIFDQSYSRR